MTSEGMTNMAWCKDCYSIWPNDPKQINRVKCSPLGMAPANELLGPCHCECHKARKPIGVFS